MLILGIWKPEEKGKIGLDDLKNPTAFAGIPLFSYGGSGIRVSYKGGNLTLWFTNSLENPNHPDRIKIVKKMISDGLVDCLSEVDKKQ